MCAFDFWERDGVAFERLPTLQELLICCDEKLLVRAVMEDHVRAEATVATPKRRKAMRKRLARTLSAMRALPVEKPSRSSVLLPREEFVLHAESGLIERGVSASLAQLGDAETVRRAIFPSVEGFERAPAEAHALPKERRYALAPWEESLAYRVWLGGPWCLRERYQVLAGAFWEMTFFGFEYDQVLARQARKRAELLLDGGASDGGRGRGGDATGPEGADGRVPTGANVRDDRAVRARAFGLELPDRFAEEQREALARCVGVLNDAAERRFWERFLSLASETKAA
ncbi:hypothetical protein B5F40_14145 [Gordonibacter sp. An230]|uniref:hypothetical protein n=1 Tax=Gordonibacter sp. An230 TaxID=1965592 RepID=UPI000B373561|nr:hypothetical protein [Gordonibacter sp. An230]OUO87136.1 hypothetical protein B5F40_14145 [Gordonibacter sp. An230]